MGNTPIKIFYLNLNSIVRKQRNYKCLIEGRQYLFAQPNNVQEAPLLLGGSHHGWTKHKYLSNQCSTLMGTT